MNKCWICRRTEEEFKNDFVENILCDEDISKDMKEAAKNGKCFVDDTDGIEDVVNIMAEGVDGWDALYLYCCPVCSGLLNMRMINARCL